MSATSGTIAVPRGRGATRRTWIAVVVIAAVMAAIAIWAFTGRDVAPTTPANDGAGPAQSVDEGRGTGPGFRYGPHGEVAPRPFTPIGG